MDVSTETSISSNGLQSYIAIMKTNGRLQGWRCNATASVILEHMMSAEPATREARPNACLPGCYVHRTRTWHFLYQSMHVRFNASAFFTLTQNTLSRSSLYLSLRCTSRCTSFPLSAHHAASTRHRLYHIVVMPPKQATLGYVRPSQTTIGCEAPPVCLRTSEYCR